MERLPIIKWWPDNEIGWYKRLEKLITKSREEPQLTMAQNNKPLADQIYRAAIETAAHLGSPTEPTAALRALAYELELRGLTVSLPSGVLPGTRQGDALVAADMLVVEGSEGICVSAGGDRGTELDLGGMLRHHHWRCAHEIVFAPETLRIKTVAG